MTNPFAPQPETNPFTVQPKPNTNRISQAAPPWVKSWLKKRNNPHPVPFWAKVVLRLYGGAVLLLGLYLWFFWFSPPYWEDFWIISLRVGAFVIGIYGCLLIRLSVLSLLPSFLLLIVSIVACCFFFIGAPIPFLNVPDYWYWSLFAPWLLYFSLLTAFIYFISQRYRRGLVFGRIEAAITFLFLFLLLLLPLTLILLIVNFIIFLK